MHITSTLANATGLQIAQNKKSKRLKGRFDSRPTLPLSQRKVGRNQAGGFEVVYGLYQAFVPSGMHVFAVKQTKN